MISEDEIISLGYEAEEAIYKAQEEIFKDIIKKLSSLEDMTQADIEQLISLHYTDFDIATRLADAMRITMEDVRRIYERVAEAEWNANRALYEFRGIPFQTYKENPVARQAVKAIMQQTQNTLENLSGTAGMVTKNGTFKSIEEWFRDTLDSAILQIWSGNFSSTKMVREAISTLANSGIRIVEYESGHKNRMNVAVRRAVMTGTRQMTQGITDKAAKDLDVDTFEVSAHAGARPSHAAWQGKVYTKKQLRTVCGLGTGAGLQGWNCYHNYYPYIKGISKRAYTDEQLAEWKSPKKTAYKGKEFTPYEAKQRMRQMESAMRIQREKATLYKVAGAQDDYTAARSKYRAQLAEYKNFAQSMGEKTQMDNRVYIDGLGRV